MRTPGRRLHAGGSGDDTVVVCGAFIVGEPEHPALRGLPRTIHVPGATGHTPPWLAPFIDALSTEAFNGGPGSDLVMARLSDALLARALRHHSDTVQLGEPTIRYLLSLRMQRARTLLRDHRATVARSPRRSATNPMPRSRPPSRAKPAAPPGAYRRSATR